jgi:hypothetical protein
MVVLLVPHQPTFARLGLPADTSFARMASLIKSDD